MKIETKHGVVKSTNLQTVANYAPTHKRLDGTVGVTSEYVRRKCIKGDIKSIEIDGVRFVVLGEGNS